MTQSTAELPATMTRLRRFREVLLAGLGLAVIAFAGWGLSRLGRLDPPSPAALTLQDRQGHCLLVVHERGPSRKPPRYVLAARPVELEPRHSMLRFGDGSSRLLPPAALAVLVHGDKRIEVLPRALPLTVLMRLKSHPPSRSDSLPEWFRQPAIARSLGDLAARLARFWR